MKYFCDIVLCGYSTAKFLNLIWFSNLVITKKNEYSLQSERTDKILLFLVWRKYYGCTQHLAETKDLSHLWKV